MFRFNIFAEECPLDVDVLPKEHHYSNDEEDSFCRILEDSIIHHQIEEELDDVEINRRIDNWINRLD